jgi:hypothetical protein
MQDALNCYLSVLKGLHRGEDRALIEKPASQAWIIMTDLFE